MEKIEKTNGEVRMKLFFMGLGCITLVLGAVGAALPLLPTVPFLLVSAFCFAKSSEKLNNWFVNTKLYKHNLERYAQGMGMSWKSKVKIILTITLLMSVGFAMMKEAPAGRIILGVVWLLHVICFCFGVKTR